MREDRPRLYVGQIRRDGKFPSQFVYPVAGARINRLLSREKLAEFIASGNYVVSGAPREMVQAVQQ